ncbi:hypothetical protein [Serratia plymuthica]|uniref:hypothetical protein n=1 Tax=Serratia plymuthica TaxID=82996 RepID=UPI0018D8471E|nr:hypothetical protein [Serratia plymuthica]QPS55580.1 hypothetical protein I6G53_23645 [Serratia plymuthica]CAI1682956.1 Uncharacterised protein [Serratia plymuthica]
MELINIVVSPFLELLRGLQSSGELSQWQVFFTFISSVLLLVIFLRIKTILGFMRNMKNSRFDELKYLYQFSDEKSIEARCINLEINKIVRYRVCGVSDVATQNLIFKVSEKNSDVIAPSFFKKYRLWIESKDGFLIFKQGAMYWIECAIFAVFALQYIMFAFLFLFYSIYLGDALALWKHVLIYTMAVILIIMFDSFWKMVPTRKECHLLKDVLSKQFEDTCSDPESADKSAL